MLSQPDLPEVSIILHMILQKMLVLPLKLDEVKQHMVP